MKKTLLLLLFVVVCVLPGWAQVKVLFMRDTTRYQVSQAALDKAYPSLTTLFRAKPEGAREAMLEHWKAFDAFMKKRTDVPQKGFNLFVYEYYQPNGKAQYVLLSTDSPQPEAVLANAVKVMTEFYSTTTYPATGSVPFRNMSGMTYGKSYVPQPRTVRRGAGMISTLEDARKTTRRDTVKILAFSRLELNSIPEIVYQFPNLEELDLSRNSIHELPARLTADIPTLKRLSLLQNAIPNDSIFITPNKHLLSLNLQGNKITRIPPSVRHNRRLESLWLGNNNLTSLDTKTLRRLRRLTDLNLYSAGLTVLPKTVKRLKHIKVLDLYYNKLKELPPQLGKMKRLEQLAVSHNDLSQLPQSLAKLRRLQTLYAHHNRISQLPDAFAKLTNLRVLNVGYNWFAVAPLVLGSLPALEELDLNNNNLQEFPAVLSKLPHLKRVYLGSNPLFGREAIKSPYAPIIRQLEANKTEVFY